MGAIYADADQFEALFTRLFDQIGEEAPDDLAQLVESHMVIRFVINKPRTEMWVDGREAEVNSTYGPADLEPTLTAEVSGNNLHKLLLGTLPLGRALLFRKLKVKGSKQEALKLESLLHALQARYPNLATEMLSVPT